MSRSEKAEATYQRILDVSNELFRKQGYEKTSIQDILNELKMSKGAVYHHFKSKKEILDAIEIKVHEANMRRLKKLAKEATGANGKEKLSQVFLKQTLSQEFDPNDVELMKAHLDPHTIVSDMKEVPGMSEFLIELVEEGMADGSITTKHPNEVLEVLFVLLNIWINPIIYPRSREEAKKRVSYLQLVMKNMGVDFISDEMVELFIATYEKGGFFQ